jgi:hypothetical protein
MLIIATNAKIQYFSFNLTVLMIGRLCTLYHSIVVTKLGRCELCLRSLSQT